MSDVTNKRVNIYIDQAAAEAAFDKLQNKADGLNTKLENVRKKQRDLRDEIDRSKQSAEKIEELKAKYDGLASTITTIQEANTKNSQAIDVSQKKMDSYADRIAIAQEKQKQLSAEIAKADEAGKSTVRLTTQYKNLTSEITALNGKLVEEENYFTQLTAKSDVYTRSISQGKAGLQQYRSEINNLKSSSGDVGQLEKAFANANRQEESYVQSLTKVEAQQSVIKTQIDAGLKPSITQQTNLVRQLQAELINLGKSDANFDKKAQEYQQAKVKLEELKVAMEGVQTVERSWWAEAKTVAFGVLIGNTVQQAIGAIGNYLGGFVTGNANLSDSLADVKKATGLTDAEINRLNSDIKKIDTRTANSELREIAIGLGQINEAADKANIESIDKIVVALGDEFEGGARQITTELGVLRNNLQDIKTANYGEDVLHIGNAVNVLGAEGLATAPVITDITKRIAAGAQQFGISSGTILGTAATFQELGIEVERGSTAYIKVLQKIAAEPEKFAKVAGIATKDFISLVNTDMQAAFIKVAEGIKTSGKNNVEYARILKDLDADGSGAGEVLNKLGSNVGILTNKITISTDALKKSDSITQEFTIKNTNLAAELDKLDKRFDALIQSKSLGEFFAGGISYINKFIDVLKAVPKYIQDNRTAISLIITGIALMNAEYIKSAAIIIRDTVIKVSNAVVTKASALANNLLTAATAAYLTIAELMTGRITILTAVQRLWNISMSLGIGIVGGLVVAIGAIVLALDAFTTKVVINTSAQQNHAAILAEVKRQTEDTKDKIQTLTKVITSSTASQDEKTKSLEKLKAISHEYLDGLTLENITTKEGIGIINDYIKSIDKLADAKAKVNLKAKLKEEILESDNKLSGLEVEKAGTPELTGFQKFLKGKDGKLFGFGDRNSFDVNSDIETEQQNRKTLQNRLDALDKDNQQQIEDYRKKIADENKKLAGLKKDSEEAKKLSRDIATDQTALFTLTGLSDSSSAPPGSNTDQPVIDNSVAAKKADLQKKIDELKKAYDDLNATDLAGQKENLAQQKKYQDELDVLNGQSHAKSISSGKDKFDSITHQVEEFNKKVRDLHVSSETAGQTQNQKEIAEAKHKYAEVLLAYEELVKKLNKTPGPKTQQLLVQLKVKAEQVKGLEEQEISGLIKKQQEKDLKATNSDNYKEQLRVSAAYFSALKEQESQRFVDGKITYADYQASLIDIDNRAKAQQVENALDYADTVKEAADDILKYQKEKLDQETKAKLAEYQKQVENAALLKQLDVDTATKVAQGDVDRTPVGSAANFKAQKNLLAISKAKELSDVEKQEADYRQRGIAFTDEFEQQKADITEKYSQEEAELNKQRLTDQVQKILNYASQAVDIIGKLNDARDAKENASLAKELKGNDARKTALQRQLNQKLISQQTYEVGLANVEREADAKKEALEKKQFERHKKQQIAQALINGAMAVTNIWATTPKVDFGVSTAILLGLSAVATIASVATIAASKYAGGGRIGFEDEDEPDGFNKPIPLPFTPKKRRLGNGKISGQSNIPMQPNGDDVLATVKLGEVILNERQQAALGGPETFKLIGVPGFAGGGVVAPRYYTQPYRAIDYTGITRSYQKVQMFANGGLIGNTTATAPAMQKADPELMEMLRQNQLVLSQVMESNAQLQQQLQQPIRGDWNLKQLEDAQNTKSRIRDAATFQ